MNQVKAFLAKYWHTILALIIVAVVLYMVYRAGKKTGANVTVTDDTGNILNPTAEQTATANTIATRIHDDLNSGTVFGYNFFGTIGRDSEAYEILAQSSDSMFSYIYNRYRALFTTSLIADIKAESSISDATVVELILSRANRLQLT